VDVTSGVATFNLAAQVALMAALLAGSLLAWRGKLRAHCSVMRGAIVGQLLLIGVIMAPQVGRYYAGWSGFSSFTTELVIHHAFGVAALLLAIYINLAFAGVFKRPKRFAWIMRVTLLAWAVSLGLGLHLYWYLWR
jgi:uncharacterized membrane protein YozB (DUF420 family)